MGLRIVLDYGGGEAGGAGLNSSTYFFSTILEELKSMLNTGTHCTKATTMAPGVSPTELPFEPQ